MPSPFSPWKAHFTLTAQGCEGPTNQEGDSALGIALTTGTDTKKQTKPNCLYSPSLLFQKSALGPGKHRGQMWGHGHTHAPHQLQESAGAGTDRHIHACERACLAHQLQGLQGGVSGQPAQFLHLNRSRPQGLTQLSAWLQPAGSPCWPNGCMTSSMLPASRRV